MGTTVNFFSISVIIPAYNAEKTIIRALESVRQQTASEYIEEVIVVLLVRGCMFICDMCWYHLFCHIFGAKKY